jgi:hypothetical protein
MHLGYRDDGLCIGPLLAHVHAQSNLAVPA